jgi:calpain family cysteine protease
LGSIAALANANLGLVEDLFIVTAISTGLYAVRFSRDGRWVFVVIDDYLPCVRVSDSSTGDDSEELIPAFAISQDDGELYISLIEKVLIP